MGQRKVRIGAELTGALQDALAYERGHAVGLRVSELPPRPRRMTPAQIRRLRASMEVSQPVFAALLNVSPKAVQSWEQGVRRPRAATLKLLCIARQDPRLLLLA